VEYGVLPPLIRKPQFSVVPLLMPRFICSICSICSTETDSSSGETGGNALHYADINNWGKLTK